MIYNDLLDKMKKEKRRMERKRGIKKLALVGLGAAIGSAAVALTTPKKGEELRKDIKKGYDDTLYNLKYKAEEIKEQVKTTVEEGKDKIDTMKAQGQKVKEELSEVIKEKAQEVKSDVKSTMSEKDNEIEDYSYKVKKAADTLEYDGKVVADDVKETKDDLYKTVKDVKSDLK